MSYICSQTINILKTMNKPLVTTSLRCLLTKVGGGILLNTRNSRRLFKLTFSLLTSVVMLLACSEEHHEPPLRSDFSESRSGAADSSATARADSAMSIGDIMVDTTWAGEQYNDFDGNPTNPDGDLLITIPDDSAEGDAADAV